MLEAFRSRFKSREPGPEVWEGLGDDVIATHGPDGRFCKVSGGSLTTFGLKPEEMSGRRLMEIVAPEFQPSLLSAMAEVADSDGPGWARFEFRLSRECQRGPALEMVLSRIPGGFRSVTRNIEHRLAREAQVRKEARDTMDVAVRHNEQLANFSHELRTPLNAVIGFAGAIHGEQFGPLGSDRYRDYARIIHESGEHLLSLISDILDLNKAEANETAAMMSEESVERLVRFCTDLIHLRADEAGLSVEISVAPGIDKAMLDAKIVRQILLNLLSNALKFTEEGGIIVTAALDGDMLEISVMDSGVGMSPDDLAIVGTRFRQARKEGVRGTRGSGIGLALSKALARVHGGELILQSAAGAGTTAVLRLPYLPVEEKPAVQNIRHTDNVVPLAAARA
jgi:two-component system, cell cycle sensor histidine kinase DivJ